MARARAGLLRDPVIWVLLAAVAAAAFLTAQLYLTPERAIAAQRDRFLAMLGLGSGDDVPAGGSGLARVDRAEPPRPARPRPDPSTPSLTAAAGTGGAVAGARPPADPPGAFAPPSTLPATRPEDGPGLARPDAGRGSPEVGEADPAPEPGGTGPLAPSDAGASPPGAGWGDGFPRDASPDPYAGGEVPDRSDPWGGRPSDPGPFAADDPGDGTPPDSVQEDGRPGPTGDLSGGENAAPEGAGARGGAPFGPVVVPAEVRPDSPAAARTLASAWMSEGRACEAVSLLERFAGDPSTRGLLDYARERCGSR